MPHLSQMYPKKTLDPADLMAAYPSGAVVTIEHVDYKTFESTNVGEAEIAWYLKVEQFKKPFKLNQSNARAIADQLGTEVTEEWVGKFITLRAISFRVTDRLTNRKKLVPVFDIDPMAPRAVPSLPRNQDITGHSATALGASPLNRALGQPVAGSSGADGALEKIGDLKAAHIVASLRERGKTVAELVKHADSLGLGQMVSGKEPPDWPALVLDCVRKFVTGHPKVNPAPTPAEIETIRKSWAPPAEVIDRKTGEVMTPAQHAAGSPAPAPTPPPKAPPIDEDDIPF